MWIAVGVGGNAMARSTNGVSWTAMGTGTFTRGWDVVWCDGINRWVAVGEGTNTIAYSNNGINWFGVTGNTIFNIGKGVSWNGSRLVAVGSGLSRIAYSDDGINWIGLGHNIVDNEGTGVNYVEILS